MRLQLKDEVEQVDDEQDDTGSTADLQDSAVSELSAGVVEGCVECSLQAC
jgi:hypothetical protein